MREQLLRLTPPFAAFLFHALIAAMLIVIIRNGSPALLPQVHVMQVTMARPPAAVTLSEPKVVKAEAKPKESIKKPSPSMVHEVKLTSTPTPAVTPITPSNTTAVASSKVAEVITTKPIFDAAYLQNPPPAYPAAARRRNIEGTVMLQCKVSAEGVAEKVDIHQSSGSVLLDEAARKAVEKWRFIPAKKGEVEVEATVVVPVVFKIE